MKTILKLMRKCNSIAKTDNLYAAKLRPVKDYANLLISNLIDSGKPMMVSRIGATELLCMTNYLGVNRYPKKGRIKKYISHQIPPWWWESSIIHQMQNNAGFFPAEIPYIERFCEMMMNDISQVDILGSWMKEESYFNKELYEAKKVPLEDIEPFFTKNPWTKSLKGKRVLVVHPFAVSIQNQYLKRELIFSDGLLPEFTLTVLPAVQSLGGESALYKNWFDAFEYMRDKIDDTKYDLCILGCGAYGLPLAAHIKRQGKQAIHLGGVTQMLFGIKGRRWENYHIYPYANLFNANWVRPNKNETPKSAISVEAGCYW